MELPVSARFFSQLKIYIYISSNFSTFDRETCTNIRFLLATDRSFGADSQVFLSQSKVKEEGVRADQDGIMHLRETNLFSSWNFEYKILPFLIF